MAKRQADDVRKWAVIGAEQRLLVIAEEAAKIFRVFPELRARGFMASGSTSQGKALADGQRPRRRRRQLSAEARKRISDAQKARWAKVRAGRKK